MVNVKFCDSFLYDCGAELVCGDELWGRSAGQATERGVVLRSSEVCLQGYWFRDTWGY